MTVLEFLKSLAHWRKRPMYTPRREQPDGIFLQPEDGAVKVWRYLSLPKLLYALDRGTLIFPRLDLLKDSYEGAPTHATQAALEQAVRPHLAATSPEIADNLIRALRERPKQLRKTFYISSWHLNDSESEAMWKLYCGDDQGVALQTTYAKLDASLPTDEASHVFIGQVNYLDYQRDLHGVGNVFTPVMYKRRAFEHEHEVRIVKWDTDPVVRHWQGSPLPEVFELPWDAEATVESIYVNPYAPQWYFDAVEAALKRFAPNLADRLTWSGMRADPWGPQDDIDD